MTQRARGAAKKVMWLTQNFSHETNNITETNDKNTSKKLYFCLITILPYTQNFNSTILST